MSESLGFVVLARRPGQPPEPVSAIFPAYPNGLEQAQNVLASCHKREPVFPPCRHGYLLAGPVVCAICTPPPNPPVEYIIGQIAERTP